MKALKIFKVMTWIVSFLKRKKNIRYKTLDPKELKIMGLGSLVLEEYINSRKFRRMFKDHDVEKYINQTLNTWDKKPLQK
tara:strand:- start:2409 stop:2648 length:240 start_codon:yes stop_codon:yes gene_type:complete